MKQKTKLTMTIVLGMIFLFTGSVNAKRYMEYLDRGVVAIYIIDEEVYVGWRMLGTDPDDIAFNLYRNDTKVNSEPITNSTNYIDNNGSTSAIYYVRAVINGQELGPSKSAAVWSQQYHTISLQVPAGPYVSSSGYTPGDASAGDLDGDGEYEIVLKWEDNPKDNSQSDYTNSPILDAYELDGTLLWRIDLGINIREGAHYTQFMVYDLDSDGRAEVACKTADGTVDGLGNVIGDPYADYRNSSGYILDGPEYLTVFDGKTGAALATTDYIPPRGNVCDWGDCYGNRVDRFLACIAYLDGERPSLVMCRGYYTRTVLAAWNWRDGELTHVWTFDSDDGTPGNYDYRGQGNHNLSVADVDEDGKDEIIYGACCIDDDGTGLWNADLGHGDAMHVSDINPDRPGLEKWGIHEHAEIGSALLDAATGEIIWGTGPGDIGRGVSADLTAEFKGMECWGGTDGLRSCTNQYAGRTPSSCNFVIWWDGDLLRELLDGYWDKVTQTCLYTLIDKYGTSGDTRLLQVNDCSTNNSTKQTPCLSADILGDWREEVVWRTSDNTALRIYSTTTLTSYRFYTLMHDPVYRLGIAWQNVAYNQPPHTGFYLGDGMASPPRPQIKLARRWSLYGDFTGDNTVNNDDLPYFFALWLADDGNETDGLDLNDDCIINAYEFAIMAENWLIADTTAPLAPTGLLATSGDATVSLDWDDNYESDVNGYNVYRSTTSGSSYSKLNSLFLSSSNYTDNSVTNGTTYYYVVTAVDISSNESNYSSEVSATPSEISSIIIQEETTGFCGVDGTIDNNHSGFTGTGFANTDNATGNGIDWRINIQSSSTYTFTWRYANGSSDRPAMLLVNGSEEVSSISFLSTDYWTSWSEVSVNLDLSTGIKDIRLEATDINGLANIDYLMVTGPAPQVASCP